MMRKLVLAGLVLGGVAAAPAAMADPRGVVTNAPVLVRNGGGTVVAAPQYRNNWGPRVSGRWSAGWNAPGGWAAYRRPVYGYVLPGYWINPAYYIADYGYYGLPQPQYGYGWSRYYDDAVLTDRYGRVVDTRYGYDWNRYGGYADEGAYYDADDGYRAARKRRKGDTVAGALVGGAVGAIAGSAIAGSGNRGTGALVGAGVGAIAGGVIADSAGRREERRYREGYAPAPAPAPYGDELSWNGQAADYSGRWVGTWYGQDGRSYSGTYDGRYEGSAGHWQQQGGAVPVLPYAPLAYGGYAGSAYQGGAVVTQVEDYAEPVVTTVTETTTYVSTRATAKRAKPRYRARPRVTCHCSCGC